MNDPLSSFDDDWLEGYASRVRKQFDASMRAWTHPTSVRDGRMAEKAMERHYDELIDIYAEMQRRGMDVPELGLLHKIKATAHGEADVEN